MKSDQAFKEVQRFVLALWQLKETTDPLLNAELMQQQLSEIYDRKQIINILKWHVQYSAPRFQLCWPSVKYKFLNPVTFKLNDIHFHLDFLDWQRTMVECSNGLYCIFKC